MYWFLMDVLDFFAGLLDIFLPKREKYNRQIRRLQRKIERVEEQRFLDGQKHPYRGFADNPFTHKRDQLFNKLVRIQWKLDDL
jgi:hypothetical protein